jgi:hypothetical protein
MIVLTPTSEQLNRLNGFKNKTSKLEFVPDGSGKLIVGTEVLNDPNFEPIKEDLKQLKQVTYTPNNAS